MNRKKDKTSPARLILVLMLAVLMLMSMLMTFLPAGLS